MYFTRSWWGNDIVRRLLLQIRHERDKNNVLRSSVMAGYPTKYEFPVYIETAERLDEIVISVNLKPREAKIIEYKIEEPHRLNIGDQVLITCIDETWISSIPLFEPRHEELEVLHFGL